MIMKQLFRMFMAAAVLVWAAACTDRREFENPELVDQNRVRPEVVIEPVPPAADLTNRVDTASPTNAPNKQEPQNRQRGNHQP